MTSNSHLSNDGVEESPPSYRSDKGAEGAKRPPSPLGLFINLEGCNVGFQHLHPMPVTHRGAQLSGQADLGGVWE